MGDGKISVPDCRVAAIKSHKRPITQKDLQSFLGITGYYRRFIDSYAHHSFHLTNAIRKNNPNTLVWSPDICREFSHLCNALTHSCSLHVPLQSDSFLLQTDASGRGISGILSVQREGLELPVRFCPRKLSPAETNYAATELEGLAVLAAITHFEIYLTGRNFVVETDHKALTFMDTAKHLNPQMTRWCLRLQHFSFTVRYRPGSHNQNADALSRQAWEDPPSRRGICHGSPCQNSKAGTSLQYTQLINKCYLICGE